MDWHHNRLTKTGRRMLRERRDKEARAKADRYYEPADDPEWEALNEYLSRLCANVRGAFPGVR